MRIKLEWINLIRIKIILEYRMCIILEILKNNKIYKFNLNKSSENVIKN